MVSDTATSAQERVYKLRNDFQKQLHNPYRHMKAEGGHIFDPNLQRYHSMRVSHWEYFKPTFVTARKGFLMVVLPIGFFAWLFKSERDAREAVYRSGTVSYADRKHKFI